MKKRIMKSTLAVALIAAAAFGGMKTYGSYVGTEESDILSENIEALSDESEPGADEKALEQKCRNEGGDWNMYSSCEASGFEEVKCEKSFELELFGLKLSGSYEKNKSYTIPWARYNCKDSKENCCTKKGLFTGEEKLA